MDEELKPDDVIKDGIQIGGLEGIEGEIENALDAFPDQHLVYRTSFVRDRIDDKSRENPTLRAKAVAAVERCIFNNIFRYYEQFAQQGLDVVDIFQLTPQEIQTESFNRQAEDLVRLLLSKRYTSAVRKLEDFFERGFLHPGIWEAEAVREGLDSFLGYNESNDRYEDRIDASTRLRKLAGLPERAES